MKAAGFVVYCVLAALANRQQYCYPSNGFLARTTGYSGSTIKRALSALERTGLISKGKSARHHRCYCLLKTHVAVHP